MAIERLKRATLLVPNSEGKLLTDELYHLGILHLIDIATHFPSALAHLKKPTVSSKEAEEKLQKLEFLLSILKPVSTTKRPFIEDFFPLPIQIREAELEELLTSFPLDRFYEEGKDIEFQRRSLEAALRDTEQEIQSMKDLLGLPWPLDKLRRLKKVKLRMVLFPRIYWEALTMDPGATSAASGLAWQEIPIEDKKRVRVLLAFLPQEEEEVMRVLNLYHFQEITLPAFSGRIEDRLKELESQRKSILEKQRVLKSRLIALTPIITKLEVLSGYWEAQRNKLLQEGSLNCSKRLMFISGYIREKDLPTLEATLQKKSPRACAFYRDPQPGEAVPVSLALSRAFRPAKFLVDMFGLPNYFTFDPTPFIVLNFFIFFGLCFSDVVYGLALIGLSYWFMRRLKTNPTARDFFSLFFYAGISTTIFGALTGGWAGDLYKPEYLGKGNLLLRLKESLCVIDPLTDILVALVCVLALGVLNQFYALFLLAYKEYRMGRPIDALLDGGLWLLFLPGIIILACSVFFPVSAELKKLARVLVMVCAVGLILTQGRREKGLVPKLLTGLVSLYGIMGTYGCTSFIGDIISYSRLLALGLTTTIIGMSFNIIAGLVGSASIVFFILTLIFGHTLNFFISIIGAFVHPARLIFLEFFGRFYEVGGLRFRPYGFQSTKIQILRE